MLSAVCFWYKDLERDWGGDGKALQGSVIRDVSTIVTLKNVPLTRLTVFTSAVNDLCSSSHQGLQTVTAFEPGAEF